MFKSFRFIVGNFSFIYGNFSFIYGNFSFIYGNFSFIVGKPCKLICKCRLPKKTLLRPEKKEFGFKEKADKITVLLFVSKTGHFMNPLFVGKFKNPRILKNIDLKKLKINYVSSKRAWMFKNFCSKSKLLFQRYPLKFFFGYFWESLL